jgi:hypothetical protein
VSAAHYRLVKLKQRHIATSSVAARVYPRTRDDSRRDPPLRLADSALDQYPLVLVPDDVRAGEHVPFAD